MFAPQIASNAPDEHDNVVITEAAPAFTDYHSQSPGREHRISAVDLPLPYASRSASTSSNRIERPADAWPRVPAGFQVQMYASGLPAPRLLRTAPNGDVFVALSEAGKIAVLRGIDEKGQAKTVATFADGLKRPYGIAFYPPGPQPQWIYVGNTDSVVRFPYRNGDLSARGEKEEVCELPGGGFLFGGGAHWTRDIAFSADGATMFVAVGSHSNDDDTDGNRAEQKRAAILRFNPDGSGLKVYAWGIRNPTSIAVHPTSGELWTSVNERDGLGDNLVPDYITHVQQGGFYGWPWYYIGGHPDPRLEGKHPELKDKVIVPDVLLQPHNASLELTFYDGDQFPSEYRGDLFAAEHGSWNRANRTGYEIIRVPLEDGHASGVFEDFITGFVTPQGEAWGRPVGVTVAKDGSLYFTDDGSKTIWRVSYSGR